MKEVEEWKSKCNEVLSPLNLFGDACMTMQCIYFLHVSKFNY